MSRRRQEALRQTEDSSSSYDIAPSSGSAAGEAAARPEPGPKKQGSLFKLSMVLWGIPIVLFATITILRNCLNLW